MKVVKFGGSSLASAGQLEKVLNIVKSDKERRFVVVSSARAGRAHRPQVAPGLEVPWRGHGRRPEGGRGRPDVRPAGNQPGGRRR